MEKSFEVKALVEKLKAKGLPEAEKLLHTVASEGLDWIQESLAIHSNKYLALGAGLVPFFKSGILKLVEQVDGQPGQAQ